jgi:hypothetical protein
MTNGWRLTGCELAPVACDRSVPYMQLADGVVVGRIMKAAAVPVGMSWMWIEVTQGIGPHPEQLAVDGLDCTLVYTEN